MKRSFLVHQGRQDNLGHSTLTVNGVDIMQGWEYAQVLHTTDGGEHIIQVHFTHQDAWPNTDVLWPALRALGDDGWELVGSPGVLPKRPMDAPEIEVHAFWFKRAVAS